jgi:hypothetical protein
MNTVHINRIKAQHFKRQRQPFELDNQLLREAVRLMVEGRQHPGDKRNTRDLQRQ